MRDQDPIHPYWLEKDVKEALNLQQEIFELLDQVEAIEENRGFFYRDRNPHRMILELLGEVEQKKERLLELSQRGLEKVKK